MNSASPAHLSDRVPLAPRLRCIAAAVLGIEAVVTSLAHGFQVRLPVVGRVVIEVRDRQNDLRPGDGGGLAVGRGATYLDLGWIDVMLRAALARAFAPAAGPVLADQPRDQRPF